MKKKGLLLISSGLDSLLSLYISKLELGIEVIAYHLKHPFHSDKSKFIKYHCKKLNVPLIIDYPDSKFLEIIKKPLHGYGKGINPCRDCRIYTFTKAKKKMRELGCDFIITGEVVGQRPMTQIKNYMFFIEKKAELKGLILRPLCGKVLPPTIMEKKGIVDKNKLYDITGRSRKKQLELTKKFGIEDFSTPSGGCLLTDRNFSLRIKDLILNDELTYPNINLLKIGRHFRLDRGIKLIIGRNKIENKILIDRKKPRYLHIKILSIPSPAGLIVFNKKFPSKKHFELSMKILSSYIKKHENLRFVITNYKDKKIFAGKITHYKQSFEKLRNNYIIL